MKAKQILFNGDKLDINNNLHQSIQRSLDSSIAGAFIVKGVIVDEANSTVEISIDWICNHHDGSKPGTLNIDEAVLFCGKLNNGGEKLPMPLHPFSNIYPYHFPVDQFVEDYNLVMKRNNNLKGLSAYSTPNNVTYKYQF